MNHMKHINISLLIIFLFTNISCGQQAAPGLQKETRTLAGFDALEVSGLAVVYFRQGPAKAAELEVSGMPIEDISMEVEEGVLSITTPGNVSGEKIAIYISSPSLRRIEVGGSAELYSKDAIQGNALEVVVDDAGAAWLDVAVDQLSIRMKGAGDLTLSGEAGDQQLRSFASRGTLDNSELKITK